MAFGRRFADQARYLVADLGDFGVKILVLTDHPGVFRGFRNAIVCPHFPETFSFQLKRKALHLALETAGSATFIDADCVVRPGVRGDLLRRALHHELSPGFHCWKTFPIREAGPYLFPEVEAVARELGFTYDRDRITCQEMLFNVTAQEGREQRFFEVWDALAAHPALDAYHKRHPVHGGTIEGVSMGIASCASGLTIQGSNEMDSIFLPKVFWHCALDYRKRRYHKARNWIVSRSGFLESADLSRSALG